MTLHRFPVNPQTDVDLLCLKHPGCVGNHDESIARMRDEDRRVRRGIGLGILIGGFLLWPTVIAFCWGVAVIAGVVMP